MIWVAALLWVLGTYLATAFADPLAEHFGLAGHAKRLLMATPTGLASLSAAVIYLTHVPPRGVLFWNRLLSRFRRRRLLAEVTVTFRPDETPTAEWIDQRVREWDQTGLLRREVPAEPVAAGEPLTRLEYTSKLGRLTISTSLPVAESSGDEQYVTIRLPSAPHESRTLVDLIQRDLFALVGRLRGSLGAPDGVRVVANFEEGTNPFLGVLLRHGVSSQSVTELQMKIAPADSQPGDYVMVHERGMELRSGSEVRLVSLMQRYIGLQ